MGFVWLQGPERIKTVVQGSVMRRNRVKFRRRVEEERPGNEAQAIVS